MPAFGRDGMLKPEQVDDLTEYVVHLSGRSANAKAVRRATQLFADNCAACHGPHGKGSREYGADRDSIHDQIWNGHGGVMPTWGGRLPPEEIKALAVYVHNLGGGE